MKAYQMLVNRVPAIQREYWRRRKLHTKPAERVLDWCALLWMNLAWSVGYRSWAADELHPDDKRLLAREAESRLHPKVPPEAYAKKLAAYDVVSFDVFDTLLLRPFERPADLFHLVGAQLGYLDFARLRAEAEGKARRRAYERKKTFEVSLEEIWEVMEEDVGIPKEEGMRVEIETELAYSFGNPYFQEVFRHLAEKMRAAEQTKQTEAKEGAACRPRIIAVSDMYLPAEVIWRMLKNCGFSAVERVYVSCGQGASKSEGSLYRKVRRELEEEAGHKLTLIHTGDNRVSDVEKAEESGWEARQYPNVNDLGERYRVRDLSAITGSLYRGLVNVHLYHGLHTYGKEYELGFVYGGLFAVGYCQWIHRYVWEHGVEKVLFLSRDGDILYRVYQKLYPDEAGKERAEYVYWSRLAATKLGAKYFKYDYFRRFLHHKVNQGYTLEQVFESMELDGMLEECLRKICSGKNAKAGGMEDARQPGTERGTEAGKKISLTKETKLTSANAEQIEAYLKLHWQEVLDYYKDQREAAGLYYHEVLEGHEKVAAVDVGWAGSGAVVLQYLVRQEWKLDCEIIGLLAGTNTVHNGIEKDTSEGLRYAGKQESYLFSQEHNRQIWKFHDAAKGHNLLWELLLSAAEGSLKGIYPKEGEAKGYEIRLGKSDKAHEEAVRKIQKGILDFAEAWMRLEKAGEKLGLWKESERGHEISGSDVYAVVKVWSDEANQQELERLFDQEGI